jgi:hypothetical protein
MALLQSNEKNLLDLQNDNYHLFDDFIDKYLEMNENQNEEVDEILEKTIQQFDRSEPIVHNISQIEQKYYEMKRQRDKAEIQEKRLQNEMLQRDIKEAEQLHQTNFKKCQAIQRKLAKCLGVKKKILMEEATDKEQLTKLKFKYSEYLFSYFKEVIEETREFSQNDYSNSIILSRSLKRMMHKESLPPSKQEHELLFPTLNDLESKIELEQNNINELSNQLSLTDEHQKRLHQEKLDLEAQINEGLLRNTQLENRASKREKNILKLRQQLREATTNPDKSLTEIFKMIKANLN